MRICSFLKVSETILTEHFLIARSEFLAVFSLSQKEKGQVEMFPVEKSEEKLTIEDLYG